MSRLIDADELKERFCEENCGKNRCVDHMDKCAWILSVEESKTAFDVDKISRELVKQKKIANKKMNESDDTYSMSYYDGFSSGLAIAIGIVKGGGIE